LELTGELRTPQGWLQWLPDQPVRTALATQPRRPAIILCGTARDELLAALDKLVAMLAEVRPAEPEPMLNLFALHGPLFPNAKAGWLVYLFPRRAHRPTCYGHGPDQFLVSPGCIDLAGLIIAPRPEDFDRLTPEVAAGLLDEVLLAPTPFAELRDAVFLAFHSASG
jgi:hypothetical protein